MSTIQIRKGVREDMPQVLEMIEELAKYEGYPSGVEMTVEDLQRDGFDSEHPYFFSIVAEDTATKKLVGHALCNFAYSSWIARSMYIEDFYVKPELRGHKIGHRLMVAICKMAVEYNCRRIDWHTLRDNSTAISFYKSHGAFDLCENENRTCYRLCRYEIISISKMDD